MQIARLILPFALVVIAAPALAQRAALTQGVDEPGRTPFTLSAANNTLNPYFASFTVPAGQRYVVEQYSVECDIAATNSMTQAAIYATVRGVQFPAFATAQFAQSNGFVGGVAVNHYAATGHGPLYADAGTSLNLFATNRTGANDFKICNFYVTGHVIANPS